MFTSLTNVLKRIAPPYEKNHWVCRHLNTPVRVSLRQEAVPGWDQEAISRKTVVLVGAGGLGGEIGEGLTRKGYGVIHNCDGDISSPSNLSRQKHLASSLYKNKSTELCRILSKQGFLGTHLYAHPCWFHELDLEALNFDVVACGVDNQYPTTRVEVCRACHFNQKPVVYVQVSRDADKGSVFIQEPGEACWACLHKPEYERSQANGERCPNVPATMDVLKAVAGFALYAIDTLCMPRTRDWNYRIFSLSDSEFGSGQMIQRRENCPVCGTSGDESVA